MKLTTILIGGAVLVGLGFYLSKKFGAKTEEDDAVVYAKEKESYGKKIHKASMFAVGAIKTGADKIAEGIKDIRSQDMVKKGIETTDKIKHDIEDLKDMVVSINVSDKASAEMDDFDAELGESEEDFMAIPIGDEDDPYGDNIEQM